MPLIPAAQYVRMSTEHQRYSPEYQMAMNAAFAAEHGFEIVRTFADLGVSGLTLEKRDGLKALLKAVLDGEAGFSVVLVYDVSRWGRFQDPDESAHYEFLCRSAGVRVRYTAEPFGDDGTLTTALVKQLKRAMAAEFSRELSNRVSGAHRGLAARGYWMGGRPPYGLRRAVVGPAGEFKGVLRPGERAAIRGDRIILIPGSTVEVRTVRAIFRAFAVHETPIREIVRGLNARGVPADASGARWSTSRVRALLHNEVYLGVCVLGKRRYRLGSRDLQPRADWIRAEGAFRPVVSRSLFAAAQRRFRVNKPVVSDEALLDELRAALARHGRLSVGILNADPVTHCAAVYLDRFGALSNAYALIGYEMSAKQRATSRAARDQKPWLNTGWRRPVVPDDVVIERLAETLRLHGRISRELIVLTPDIPTHNLLMRRFGGMRGIYDALGYEPDASQQRAMRTGRVRRPPELAAADAAWTAERWALRGA